MRIRLRCFTFGGFFFDLFIVSFRTKTIKSQIGSMVLDDHNEKGSSRIRHKTEDLFLEALDRTA